MIITIGAIVGGVAGFLYWKYVGCGTGVLLPQFRIKALCMGCQ